MKRYMLKSKIHRATVTDADLNYEGSISIDPVLCKAADLVEFEKVDVYDIDNGNRLTTYVIWGKPGEICLNGAAARLVNSAQHLDRDRAERSGRRVLRVDHVGAAVMDVDRGLRVAEAVSVSSRAGRHHERVPRGGAVDHA